MQADSPCLYVQFCVLNPISIKKKGHLGQARARPRYFHFALFLFYQNIFGIILKIAILSTYIPA